MVGGDKSQHGLARILAIGVAFGRVIAPKDMQHVFLQRGKGRAFLEPFASQGPIHPFAICWMLFRGCSKAPLCPTRIFEDDAQSDRKQNQAARSGENTDYRGAYNNGPTDKDHRPSIGWSFM
jgi:hypothetical protein